MDSDIRAGRGKVCVLLVDDSVLTEKGLSALISCCEQAAAAGCAGYICVGQGSIDWLALIEHTVTAYWIDNYMEAPEGQIYLALAPWEHGVGRFSERILARFGAVLEYCCSCGGVEEST